MRMQDAARGLQEAAGSYWRSAGSAPRAVAFSSGCSPLPRQFSDPPVKLSQLPDVLLAKAYLLLHHPIAILQDVQMSEDLYEAGLELFVFLSGSAKRQYCLLPTVPHLCHQTGLAP